MGLIKHHAKKEYERMEVNFHAFLTSELKWKWVTSSHFGCFMHGEKSPSTHFMGVWVVPRASVWWFTENKSLCRGRVSNDCLVAQLVAIHYIGSAAQLFRHLHISRRPLFYLTSGMSHLLARGQSVDWATLITVGRQKVTTDIFQIK